MTTELSSADFTGDNGIQYRMPTGISLEIDTCWVQWQKFKDSFKIFLLAAGLDRITETRKAALLLNCIGSQALDLYLNVLKEEDKPKLEDLIKVFDKYFKPKQNEVMCTFNFNKRCQEEEESFDEFYTDIKKLAENCNFGENKNRMLRDRIVIGVKHPRVQQKLLEIRDLTLEKAVDLCRSTELSSGHVKKLNNSEMHAVEVKSAHQQRPLSNSKAKYTNYKSNSNNCQNNSNNKTYKCKKCNTVHGPIQCPAFGKTCNNCNKLNHFSVGCKYKKKIVDKSHNL